MNNIMNNMPGRSHAVKALIQWVEYKEVGKVGDYVAGLINSKIGSEIGRDTRAETDSFLLAVPGGRTPFPVFEDLSHRHLPWQNISFLLTDDRVVDHDHPASNYGKIDCGLLPG